MSADHTRAEDLTRLGHRGIIDLCLRGSRLSLDCARHQMSTERISFRFACGALVCVILVYLMLLITTTHLRHPGGIGGRRSL
jgi:hypothetical protein